MLDPRPEPLGRGPRRTRPTASPCAFPLKAGSVWPGRSGSVALRRLLRAVHLAPRQQVRSLVLWPLVRSPSSMTRSAGALRILTLARGLEDGFVSLEQARSGAGPSGVPETRSGRSARGVRVGNRAADPVLVLFGEELPGGSALAASASLLVPPRSELDIEVHAMSPGGGPPDAARGFRCLQGQVGFVAARGDAVVGLEAMGDPQLFASSLAALLRGYTAADAALRSWPAGRDRAACFEAPEPFLAALERACVLTAGAPGLGSDLRILGTGVAGCALEAGRIVHLTAFPDLED